MPVRLTYTVPEVAGLLGISRSSAYECVRRGEIPALTLGRRVEVAKATIDAMLSLGSREIAVDLGADGVVVTYGDIDHRRVIETVVIPTRQCWDHVPCLVYVRSPRIRE